MNKEGKNVFEETVDILIKDARSLQNKFTTLQEKNDFRGALDAMRLLKDTLSLIKEYDWELKYSEYKTDEHKEVAVWEQNHSGEIRNHKKWIVTESTDIDTNRWYKMFEDYITYGTGCIVDSSDFHRGTGKSYALAKLCNKYNGIVVYNHTCSPWGIKNADCELGITNTFVKYQYYISNVKQYEDKIIFIDEGHGLSNENIRNLQINHIVVGFQ